MAAPGDFEALKQRLVEIEPTLPKRLKQTAAFALQHPDEIALGTASGVARRAHVQAFDLGAVRAGAGLRRLHRASGPVPRPPAQPLAGISRAPQDPARATNPAIPMALLAGFADAAGRSVAALRDEIDAEALAGGGATFSAQARVVFLLAQRRSFGVAHYLAYAFAQLGAPALLVDDIGGLGREQLAGRRPRRRRAGDQLRALFAGDAGAGADGAGARGAASSP